MSKTSWNIFLPLIIDFSIYYFLGCNCHNKSKKPRKNEFEMSSHKKVNHEKLIVSYRKLHYGSKQQWILIKLSQSSGTIVKSSVVQ